MPHPFLASRTAGVLLHVTSLANGVLDDEAERFIDWLAEAGQRWWQILPLAPPDHYGSPYAGLSAFAACDGLVPPTAVGPATADEVAAFREEHGEWAAGWEAYAGPGSLAGQVRFKRRWDEIRSYAADREIRIMGDLPLYVAQDGADRRANPGLFRNDGVAGCPPDYFAEDGQLWGNPLYDWQRMRADGFAWWVARLGRALELFDAVRIDHFRGLAAYWDIPAHAQTAREGSWQPGPGRELLTAVNERLGAPALIAEDLGVITPDVEELRLAFDLPGMAVLQFEVEHHPAQEGRLWHEPVRVVYPGTHDNATSAQWLEQASDHQRWCVDESVRRAGGEPVGGAWSLVQLAHAAPANTAIVCAQDLLGLGAEARMNTPGSTHGNWAWRLQPGQLTGELARRLRELTAATGRT